MITHTPSGAIFKSRGGGSSLGSRLWDKRSSRVAVAVMAMLSLVFTTFAGTATSFASPTGPNPEGPNVEGVEDQVSPAVAEDPNAESDPPEEGGDGLAPPANNSGGDDSDSAPANSVGGASLFSDDSKDADEGGSSDISPFAAGDPFYPSDAPGVIYSSQGDGQVHQVTYNSANGTYVRENFGSKAPNVSSFNGLGISPGPGREMYAYERSGSNPSVSSATVYTFNQQTGAWSNTGATVNTKNAGMGGAIQFIAGAVDPGGSFYMGGYSENGNVFRLYKYTPSNGGSGQVTYVGYVDTSSILGGTNGDMDFDRLGNLYITRCCGQYGTTVISVSAASLASPGSNNRISATIAQTVGGARMPDVTGVTFDSTGHMFLGSATALYVYDMPGVNNQIQASGSGLNSSDLASASSPPIINLQKNVDGDRFEDTDQFTLMLESLGNTQTEWQPIATRTTTGTEGGIQAEHVGPFPVTVGNEIKIKEAPAGTTDFDNYKTSLECVDSQGQAISVVTDEGVEGTFEYPAHTRSVTCTFTNKAQKPDLVVSKSADPASGSDVAVGDTIKYTLTFNNEGGTGDAAVDHTDALAQVLTNAEIVDGTLTVGDGLTAEFEADLLKVMGTVPEGEVSTVTFDVLVTKAGGNNALVNYLVPGTDDPQVPDNPEDCDEEDGCHFTEHFLPDLKPSKSSDPASGQGVAAGSEVTYTLTFDNSAGKAPATVESTDALTQVWSGAELVAGSLTVGAGLTAQWTVIDDLEISGTVAAGAVSTVSFKVKVSADNEGKIVNFLVPGDDNPEPPEECEPQDPLCTEHPIPSIAIQKFAMKKQVSPEGLEEYVPFTGTDFEVGETIYYRYKVTNDGALALTDVKVVEHADDWTGSGALPDPACEATELAPEASTWCMAEYVLVQEDIDRGSIRNVAHSEGTPPEGPPTESPPDEVDVPSAGLVLEKSGPEKFELGQEYTYNFKVTNSGSLTAYNVEIVEITDPPMKWTGSNPDGVTDLACPSLPNGGLAPGASVTCTGKYVPVAADVERTTILNTAVAEGTTTQDPEDPNVVEIRSEESQWLTRADQRPSLELVKEGSPNPYVAGDEITYTFTVTNTGNTRLYEGEVREGTFTGENGPLNDPTCDRTFLEPAGMDGDTVVCTVNYVATEADVEQGSLENDAIAYGTPPGFNPETERPWEPVPSNEDDETLLAYNPSLELVKDADKDEYTVGDVITYTFTVTNTGNQKLDNVKVEETAFTGTPEALDEPVCEETTLQPGESTTCSVEYTATQADVDQGQLENTAVAWGTPPDPRDPEKPGEPVPSDPDDKDIPSLYNPALTLVKTVEEDSYAEVGDLLNYTFTVENTGNVTLADVTIDERAFSGVGDIADLQCAETTLAPTEETTCTANYVVQQPDIDATRIDNTAVALGTPPKDEDGNDRDPVESNPDDATVPASLDPAIALTKAATLKVEESGEVKYLPFLANDFVEGGTITYVFQVINTGNVALSDVTVDEVDFSGTGTPPAVTCDASTLPAGESTQCTADYVITEADVQAGEVTNAAVANGTPPNPEDPEEPGEPVESPPAEAEAPGAAIALEKTADTQKFVVGEEVTYSFKVTNVGKVALTDIEVHEQSFNGRGGPMSDIECPANELDVGEYMTCNATYVPVQEDVDYGRLDNVATAEGTPPGDPENGRPGEPIETPPSRVEIPADQAPALVLEKVADTNPYSEGDLITYTFTVTNAGNVTLNNVSVQETAFDGENDISAVSCPASVLAPEASMECTATYTATVADVDQGSLTNVAVAKGQTPPNPETPDEPGEPVDSDPADEVIDALWEPALVPSKSVDPESGTAVLSGTDLTYTLTFANSEGRVEAEVAYTDVLSGLRQNAEVDEGSLVAEDGLEAEFDANGNIGVTGFVPAGETRTVTFTVTSKAVTSKAGADNVLTNVLVETPPPGEEPPAPGDCEPEDPLCVENPIPALDLQKYATKKVEVDGEVKYLPFIANDFEAGNTITYLFQVSNVGGVVLNDIQVNETEFSGSGTIPVVSCPLTPLPVGESMQCTANYTITEADVEAGVIDNAATATGNPPVGPPPVSPPAEAQAPAANITLEKTADTEQFQVDQDVTYTFTVTNNGEVDLTDVLVNEVSFNGSGDLSAVECPATTLAVGESMECTANYTPTNEDVDRGSLHNVADAEGTPPGDPNDPDRPGEPVKSPPDEVKIPGPEHDPALEILKTADTDGFEVGEEVTYTFAVTNTGNVTLTNVEVNEVSFNGSGDLSAVECPANKLAAGDSMECTATYVPTQADMDRGEITNAAAAEGTPPTDPSDPGKPDEPIETPPSEVEVPGLQDPALDLVKTADKQKVTKAGEIVTYTFKVSNTGNVTVTNVAVEETKFSGHGTLPDPTCTETTLAPGESTLCTAKYTVVEKDLKSKEITNVAIATGETPSDPNNPDKPGEPVKSDPDDELVQVDPPVVPGRPNLPKTGAALSLGLLGVAALGIGAVLRRRFESGERVS